MHNFEQVRDVIDYGKTIHAELQKFYESLNKQSEQARVKLLLDYLSRHERHLLEILERYEDGSQHKVMETWLQYAPNVNIQQLIQSKPILADMPFDDVVSMAVEFDDAVVELYREAAIECEIPSVKEVFENLVALEQQEKSSLIRAALFQDM